MRTVLMVGSNSMTVGLHWENTVRMIILVLVLGCTKSCWLVLEAGLGDSNTGEIMKQFVHPLLPSVLTVCCLLKELLAIKKTESYGLWVTVGAKQRGTSSIPPSIATSIILTTITWWLPGTECLVKETYYRFLDFSWDGLVGPEHMITVQTNTALRHVLWQRSAGWSRQSR